jgi:hypothetical protein
MRRRDPIVLMGLTQGDWYRYPLNVNGGDVTSSLGGNVWDSALILRQQVYIVVTSLWYHQDQTWKCEECVVLLHLGGDPRGQVAHKHGHALILSSIFTRCMKLC